MRLRSLLDGGVFLLYVVNESRCLRKLRIKEKMRIERIAKEKLFIA